MKKTLYLMRHGQTLFNIRGKIQGWVDSPLTEEGIRQAGYAKRYFEDHRITFDYAYSSTSERASDTLELVTEMPYTRLKGIKEMNHGMFEGESEQLHPPFWFDPSHPERDRRADYYVTFGGESSSQLLERMIKTLTEIMAREGHETVLVVSHIGAMANFLMHVAPAFKMREPGGFMFTNCCILKLEFEDGKFTFIEGIEHDFAK
ncbi:MAG: histidine phosphatase family protein [Turicibacter sp.]|nr:histidine phosphatase family protein [Turicibacter sp.]